MSLSHIFKAKYKALTPQDKKVIGEAIVKVNLGVGTPTDLKIVAGLLKGTGYVAKPGGLDEVITLINEKSEDEKKATTRNQGGTTTFAAPVITDEEIHKMMMDDNDEPTRQIKP